MDHLDDNDEVCSYDDLSVSTSAAGHVILECPNCGVLPVARRHTTLSDLTNAALEHLLEVHPHSLTLARGRPVASRSTAEDLGRTNLELDQFHVDNFWSLIALLGPKGAAGDIEALVRGLSTSREDSILAFHHQLMSAVEALDTPAHARQEVSDLVSPHPGLFPAPTDVFLHARVAVVAAGPGIYASVLTEPAKLAGQWPLQAAELVLRAAPAAFARVTRLPWLDRRPTAPHPPQAAVADQGHGEAALTAEGARA